jgi:hypothetical protein
VLARGWPRPRESAPPVPGRRCARHGQLQECITSVFGKKLDVGRHPHVESPYRVDQRVGDEGAVVVASIGMSKCSRIWSSSSITSDCSRASSGIASVQPVTMSVLARSAASPVPHDPHRRSVAARIRARPRGAFHGASSSGPNANSLRYHDRRRRPTNVGSRPSRSRTRMDAARSSKLGHPPLVGVELRIPRSSRRPPRQHLRQRPRLEHQWCRG